MVKYHVNSKGETKVCTAKGKCRFAPEIEHTNTSEEALSKTEIRQQFKTFKKIKKDYKDSDWEDKPWGVRKLELIEIFNRGLDLLLADKLKFADGVKILGIKNLKVEWVDAFYEEVEPGIVKKKPRILGKTISDPSDDGKILKFKKVQFTEQLETLGESHAKEVIVHELGHVKGFIQDFKNGINIKDEGYDDHNEAWQDANMELIAYFELENLIEVPLPKRTSLDDDEQDRVEIRLSQNLNKKWNFTCLKGHRIFLNERNLINNEVLCPLCERDEKQKQIISKLEKYKSHVNTSDLRVKGRKNNDV